ncbi:protein rolling stone-like [Engraulis encrasicolus]|uniref:protein rolling stone-like n=1 Tax=Engraulis encrasicolus TaxID=184585 RepID=UPI002FD045D4
MTWSWTRSWREEFKARKLTFRPYAPELLLHPQWHISPWLWLLYRFLMVCYTLGWCLYSGLLFSTPKWLIYISHLTYCMLGLYYLLALFNLAGAMLLVRRHSKNLATAARQGNNNREIRGTTGSLGPFPLPSPLIACLRIQWFLLTFVGTYSLTVSFLYWVAVYPVEDHKLSAFNVNMHVGNILQSLLDLSLSATPVHLAHYVHLLLSGCCYVAFAVLYWLAGFTNLSREPFIYKVLDFGSSPLSASLCILGFTLVCLPLFHFLLWNVYQLRRRLALGVRGQAWALRQGLWWWKVAQTEEPIPMSVTDTSTTSVSTSTSTSLFSSSSGMGHEEGVNQPLLVAAGSNRVTVAVYI